MNYFSKQPTKCCVQTKHPCRSHALIKRVSQGSVHETQGNDFTLCHQAEPLVLWWEIQIEKNIFLLEKYL